MIGEDPGVSATRRPWTAARALPLVAEARERWGLDPQAPAELLRLGTNASYRVGETVVRIAPAGRAREAVERELELARFLATADVPAVRPSDLDQPIAVDGHWATAWRWIPHDPEAVVDGAAFGALLRRFHDATDRYDAPLPEWDALELIEHRLAGLHDHPAFSADEVALLEATLSELRDALAALDDTMPRGVIHGDAHPGNVIAAEDGSGAVLADFDLIGRGPRAWDLGPAALFPRRYGADPSWWEAVRVGYDRPEDPSWEVCLRVRELASAAWLFAGEDTTPGPGGTIRRSAEADVRMRAFTGEPDPPVWGRR